MTDIDNVRIPIDSEEFANAWRIVSEALLQHIQRGGVFPFPPGQPSSKQTIAGQTGEQTKELVDILPSEPPKKSERKIVGNYYAVDPLTNSNREYIFKRRGLKEDQDSNHLYHVICFDDNTFEFELIPTLEKEGRENFKNSTKREEFILVNGQITPDCPIKIIHKGKGIFDGRFYKITEPVEVDLTGTE
ncbi:MAG: hypothetical protein K2H47_05895 [Muribaculaceae bacterium]|nr:hypothetical protein [Muribaculaceae bacterium]